MVKVDVGKGVKVLFLSFLMLAIIWAFSFSAGEGYFYKDNSEYLESGSYIVSVNYTADCLAEGIIKNGYRYSQFRNGLLRIFAITDICFTDAHFSKSYYKIIKNIYIPITKDQILLKLRI
ncbi:MAG: hypothetical protein LBU88_09525 [Treponema sp.]|jgi:hypothetical protein|nr:hypothetical protein [Treponema sp.]